MRLDRGRLEIRFLFELESILIEFLTRFQRSDYSSRRIRFEFGPRIVEFDRKLVEFEPNLPNLPIFGLFRFKFDQFLI